jgi:adenosylhomocysteine nucleosidase
VDRVVATPEEKRALGAGGALAVDLESAQVARAATEAGVAWLALRAIVDDAHTALPAFAGKAQTSFVWPALRHALHGPSAVLQLVQLALAERAASASLSRALAALGAALP